MANPAPEKRLQADFGLTPVVASEIEFYLHGAARADMPAFWERVRSRCREQGIPLFKCEKEKGAEQYEIALAHHADVENLRMIRHPSRPSSPKRRSTMA